MSPIQTVNLIQGFSCCLYGLLNRQQQILHKAVKFKNKDLYCCAVFILALVHAIRKIHVNQEELKLNGKMSV